MVEFEPLRPVDAQLLDVETPLEPLHTVSMVTVERGPLVGADGELDMALVRRIVSHHLDTVPRTRQRIQVSPARRHLPVWIDDADFDLGAHVRRIRPADGLRRAAERLLAEPLDRGRPLWQAKIADLPESDTVGILLATHPVLVDGVTSIDLLTPLLTGEPGSPPELATWSARPAPTPSELAERLAADGAPAPDTPPERQGAPEPQLAINGTLGPRRAVATCAVSLGSLKDVKDAFGCTLNDLVVAACAAVARQEMSDDAQDAPSAPVVAAVPVSVRDDAGVTALGGQIVTRVIDLPVDVADPLGRLHAVQDTQEALKSSGMALGAGELVGRDDWPPATQLALVTRSLVGAAPHHLAITNLPGPTSERWFGPSQVTEALHLMPPQQGHGLTITATSHRRQVIFGLSADPDLVPDVEGLAASIERSMAELSGLLG